MGYDFSTLQPHSQAKLDILKTYLESWIWKVTQHKSSIHKGCCLMIDGFAGKGEHNDDKVGSPLIMIETAVRFFNSAFNTNLSAKRVRILVIENDATTFQDLCSSIDNKYGTSLCSGEGRQTIPDYPGIEVLIRKGRFADELTKFLEAEKNLEPSICFADPSGYLQVPLGLARSYLRQPSSEFFVNFIYEEFNRFISVPKANTKSALNMPEADHEIFATSLKGLPAIERRERIALLFADRFHAHGAQYVHSFDIRKSGKLKMILFFGTNSLEGLKLMKKVMWNQGEIGHYVFDDRKNPQQMQFEFVAEIDEAQHILSLSNLILAEFQGQSSVSINTIEHFVLVKTIFPVLREKLILQALNRLSEERRITVEDKHRYKNGRIIWSKADISFV
jgi:three-Cys-motif partner protein